MHRSRLQVVLIDSPPDVAEAEIAFWAAALGHEPKPEAGTFTEIAPFGTGPVLAHQRLQEGGSRIHLDVETDDPDAEVTTGTARCGEGRRQRRLSSTCVTPRD